MAASSSGARNTKIASEPRGTGRWRLAAGITEPGWKLRLPGRTRPAVQQTRQPPVGRPRGTDRPRDHRTGRRVDENREHRWPAVLQIYGEHEFRVPAVVPARIGDVAPAELAPTVKRLVGSQEGRMPAPLRAAMQRRDGLLGAQYPQLAGRRVPDPDEDLAYLRGQ